MFVSCNLSFGLGRLQEGYLLSKGTERKGAQLNRYSRHSMKSCAQAGEHVPNFILMCSIFYWKRLSDRITEYLVVGGRLSQTLGSHLLSAHPRVPQPLHL